jgi:hypothetical protein
MSMAKILIQGERATAEVLDLNIDPIDGADDEPWYVYQCEHGHEGTDRGGFGDTIAIAEVHVDLQCPGPNSSERGGGVMGWVDPETGLSSGPIASPEYLLRCQHCCEDIRELNGFYEDSRGFTRCRKDVGHRPLPSVAPRSSEQKETDA